MQPTPDIVPITDFRKDAARIMARAAGEGAPVFVTQNGRLTAVLLSRQRYDQLLALAAAGASASEQDTAAGPQAPAGTPVAGFPPTRPRLRVETLYGPADPELAAFYASEGIWTEDQGGPRPPRPWARDRAAEGDEV
jgi:prevent-host-death family protein